MFFMLLDKTYNVLVKKVIQWKLSILQNVKNFYWFE